MLQYLTNFLFFAIILMINLKTPLVKLFVIHETILNSFIPIIRMNCRGKKKERERVLTWHEKYAQKIGRRSEKISIKKKKQKAAKALCCFVKNLSVMLLVL